VPSSTGVEATHYVTVYDDETESERSKLRQQLGFNWKIRHGAIVANGVTYVYAKFGDDRL